MKTTLLAGLTVLGLAHSLAREFYVAPGGDDAGPGSKGAPLRTIQRAADLAQPGDIITVRAGVYRERITPPRGGESDTKRIVYRAFPGERVEVKGSERIEQWIKVQENVWKVTLPNWFFGAFNPYNDLIHGDWFEAKGRPHHTGAVYLNGDWLVEATRLDEVLAPLDMPVSWMAERSTGYLLNVAWLQPRRGSVAGNRLPAAAFAEQQGVQKAACSEGGECIGWIDAGDWVRYEQVDFGPGSAEMEIRAASATEGGVIDIHSGGPDGELLGTCPVSNTGDWQSWQSFRAKIKPTSGRQTVCLVFQARNASEGTPQAPPARLWFARVDETNTTIWAQFKDLNPNRELVEINARRAVFYPDKPNRNYITVRGFKLAQAATPWAPPTAEQVGLIGTHWSQGWIIESNVISHSTCSGIALGKHGDAWDNTSANSAEGYVKTIERARANGWNRETIGHHLVRGNIISHCEQTGIVGSLGAAFSTVSDNVIHDIHVRRLFTGAEMAGIKFHAAIDTVIRNNHIYRTCRGLWLDWMAQGTRISANLFHDNAGEDLFVEVDHGPFLADNNLFLSAVSLLDMSEGGAYAHNLFAGKIISRPEPSRETPYHPAHSTTVAGLVQIKGGDDRFYNNLIIPPSTASATPEKDPEWRGGYGLWVYNFREQALQTGGNVYYNGARPYSTENNPTLLAETDPKLRLLQEPGRFALSLHLGPELKEASTTQVTTRLLGLAKIPQLAYEDASGAPLTVNRDFFGRSRNKKHPTPGPFETPGQGEVTLQLR